MQNKSLLCLIDVRLWANSEVEKRPYPKLQDGCFVHFQPLQSRFIGLFLGVATCKNSTFTSLQQIIYRKLDQRTRKVLSLQHHFHFIIQDII